MYTVLGTSFMTTQSLEETGVYLILLKISLHLIIRGYYWAPNAVKGRIFETVTIQHQGTLLQPVRQIDRV